MAGAKVKVGLTAAGINQGVPVGTPTSSIILNGQRDTPVRLETDRNGHAVLNLNGDNPNNPRKFIDGQVYRAAGSTLQVPYR